MAHYKRGRCRFRGKTRRNSQSFIRSRMGLKPVIMPEWPDAGFRGSLRHTVEYMRQIEERRRLWPEWYCWYGSEPRWHTIMHHTRPRRAKERALARLATMDRIDLDNATWPLGRRPLIYYW